MKSLIIILLLLINSFSIKAAILDGAILTGVIETLLKSNEVVLLSNNIKYKVPKEYFGVGVILEKGKIATAVVPFEEYQTLPIVK